MSKHLKVQINQTVQINTHHVVQNRIAKSADIIKLIGQAEFVDLFKKYRPVLSQQCNEHYLSNPDLFWNHLFGNIGWALQHGQNKKANYLTEESAHLILQNFEKFVSGFDFYNRPRGFLMIKNPHTGILDVLHYSSNFHQLQKESPPNFLAISLDSPDSEQAMPSNPHPFKGHQKEWYDALQQKCRLANGQIICTEQELQSAFIRFSQTIEEFGLEFYPPVFESKFLNYPVNPIVLLARWETVLRNRNLKVADRKAQWDIILALHLETGDNAIRAISDYENDNNPCGILLPEMNLVKEDFLETENTQGELKRYWGFRSVYEPKAINNIKDFWRYIAFQPNRHSKQFYIEALKAIQEIELINDVNQLKLVQLLVSATTGFNAAHDSTEEDHILAIWIEICSIINRWETMNPITYMLGGIISQQKKSELRNELVDHLCRLESSPNIFWLNMIFGHIKHYFSRATSTDDSPLRKLSNSLNLVVSRLKMATYKGAKFLCNNGNWITTGIKDYVEMQERLCDTAGPLHSLLAAHLSTFNVKDEKRYIEDIGKLHFIDNALLIFTLKILEDIKTNKDLKWNNLFTICSLISSGKLNTEMEVLNYLEKNLSRVFEKNYFTQKKQQLLQALSGLNVEQIAFIDQLGFSTEQSVNIKRILSLVSTKNPLLEENKFQNLALRFRDFSQIFTSSDVGKFFNNLADLEYLITDLDDLNSLLDLLIEKRKLSDFENIYFRNKIIKNDDHLLKKFNYYISSIQGIIDAYPGLDPASLQNFFAIFILHSNPDEYDEGQVATLLSDLEEIIRVNPHIQNYIFLNLQNISETDKPNYISNTLQFVHTLTSIHKLLSTEDGRSDIQNMQIFYTLLAKYAQNPQACIALFTLLQDKNLDLEKIKFIIQLISRLLAENQSLDSIQDTVKYIVFLNSERYQHFVNCYQYPPYAPIQTWHEWSQKPETLLNQYREFCLSPFGTRKLEYAFDLQHYHRQKSLFNGLIRNGEPFSPDLFTDELGQQLNEALTENRQKSIPELQQIYQNACAKRDKLNMLCAAIELLARTTSQKDLTSDRQISQEMNTTQVMTAYAALAHPTAKLQFEMDTGEGKSRVLMVLAACKTHLGFTSDFITADFQLAERDYFAYKSFFTSLNIPTSLITLSTPELLYQRNGVNFSDNEQLQLARNKSDIDNKPFAFLNPDPTQRCLLLDEIDKFKKDKSQYACNYATQSIKFQEFTWIYSHLVQFMRAPNNFKHGLLERSDYQAKVDAFLDYLSTHETDPVRIAQTYAFHHAHPDQISIWLHSADLAIKKMKLGSDYAITEQMFSVYDGSNIRLSQKALVLNNGRPAEGALFSDGVHQCLLALLNIQAGSEKYVIPPEIETQRTSYSINFINKYDEGQIIGASATTRSAGPIADPVINHENYGYLSVPRERPLQREVKNIWPAKDRKQQIEFIKRVLLEKLAKGSPALIICKDDNQSLALYNILSKDPELAGVFTRIHGLSTPEEEKEAIKQAGQARQVTFSTAGMFSRGVDIEANNLLVLAAYVPTLDDEIQIMGRTSRAGKPGEYQMIPDLSDEDLLIDGKTYNIYNEVDKYQKRLAVEAEFQESVNVLYALFLEQITQAFLQTRPSPDQTELWLLKWQDYLNNMQKNWENNSELLLRSLNENNKDRFIAQFEGFTQKWGTQLVKIFPNAPIEPTFLLKDKTTKIFDSAAHQVTFFQPKRQAIKVQHRYDPSDDGQARIYDSLFVDIKASFRGERQWFADFYAWRDGRGSLFPNLMAALHGERPLFADLIETVKRWIKELKEYYQASFVDEPRNQTVPSIVVC
ncbi:MULTISPECIES: helicase-related protein [Legionella]|uniref:Coiled-coil protein n=1 Tax=Legionella maceachernii TaxID=466 RepID=A0A0W0W0K3_9GAMM|nr:helicase-related protein [Legionella maceachernii]KTD26039.1 coiled-coil protein [Legionella maceachernii]SJZ51391.1 Helicase conserved C-terminal domain-containing protein [Legionella maceachernii]SUP03685.1 preprotein translocase subunit SecA [Legionella maceachernii]